MYAPIDLSGIPGFTRPVDDRVHSTAFLGRTSTKDAQNPRTSICGQATLCATRLEAGAEFDRYYWDVESGYLGLDDRSQHGEDYYAALEIPLRRDGGINDLLTAVQEGHITRVVCERSDRAARDLLAILTVERFIADHGVELVYATEPQTVARTGRAGELSASELQMRRGGQMQAEVYGKIRRENSERGQVQHAANGWSHGCAPYPYITAVDPDAPAPADRFLHRPKQRLQRHPDPRRWATAERMAELRRAGAEYADIRDELNNDPDRYPYDRTGKRWPVRRIRSLLLNPRLSGYAVFNRRCNRDGWQANPISEWAWSTVPAHPAVFSIDDWAEFMRMDAARTPADPIAQLRYAAEQQGLAFHLAREDDAHAVYAIGDREFTLPARKVPQAAVDAVLTWLATA